MRHLTILALCLAAACGGKSDKTGTTTPENETEPEPEGGGNRVHVTDEQTWIYGTLVSVSVTDDGCTVEIRDNESEDGASATYRAKAFLCEEGYADYLDSPVSLTLEACTDESECFMVGDLIVVQIDGMAPG